MVELSERKRMEYEAHQPVFWRKARDSAARQGAYFAHLLDRPGIVVLVAEAAAVDAFVIGSVVPAPPVYDPGGLTCMIDDFVVREPGRWHDLGAALLAALAAHARERGAVQMAVVCGSHDESKRDLLRAAGLSVASVWYVGWPATP
jgi:GNAT superfamily N-acetyltransferase